jgi:hypothetical protein
MNGSGIKLECRKNVLAAGSAIAILSGNDDSADD